MNVEKNFCLSTQSQKYAHKVTKFKKRCFVFLSNFLWQTSTYLPNCIVSHPKWQQSMNFIHQQVMN